MFPPRRAARSNTAAGLDLANSDQRLTKLLTVAMRRRLSTRIAIEMPGCSVAHVVNEISRVGYEQGRSSVAAPVTNRARRRSTAT